MKPNNVRALVGLGTVTAIAAIIALSVGLFRDSFSDPVPITVVADRAGLVMNPDAKVKLRGVQVGKVASIEARSDGTAVLHLAIDPTQLHFIPFDVGVDIASSTVFGAKYVQFDPPPNPSPQKLHAGQVIQGQHVTVEINTVFQQLVAVLDKIDPAKLNQTLGAIATAFNGRGEKFGQTLSDLNAFLAKIEPSLPSLSHDIETSVPMLNAYADAAPDLIKTVDNSTRLSRTIVDQQQQLDEFLVSTIGLADVGNDVISGDRQSITDLVHLLVPTTDLLNKYHAAMNCGISGLIPLAKAPPLPVPGALFDASFQLGSERYRYPTNLPKVAATGGPQCTDLPVVPAGKRTPFVVADIGANPWEYGNQGLLLNSDALKQFLFGPIAGPPRNSMQIGMPG
ncbi:MCE family protein [Mycobacterium sp. AZCC_0083]|uniref:MCE family protein n=1 Tax=Mycobacterium sp. AZCC_0083 TaxID=2735882 RepID=UPI0016134731|nr:MCE family protein [Mycobacterium sp. AZCC_0083]MBB5166418.1 virulence factor Mce-like protein [Mycobacterium sp. AZCC_0083]